MGVGGQNAKNSEYSGGGQGGSLFLQDEGSSVLGQGQYGWPECIEFRVFWRWTGVVGLSHDEGLIVLGQGKYWRSECEEFRAFW